MINGRYVGTWTLHHRITEETYALAAKAFNDLVSTTLQCVDTAAAAKRDQNLSPIGQKNAVRDWSRTIGAPIVKAGIQKSIELRAKAAELKTKATPGYDKTDLVGYWRRREFREHVATWSQERRMSHLLLGKFTPDEAAAILEVRTEISGFSDTQAAKLAELQEIANLASDPKAAREVEDLEQAATAIENAVRAAGLALKTTGELGQDGLNAVLGLPTYEDRFRTLVRDIVPDDAQDDEDSAEDAANENDDEPNDEPAKDLED